MLTSEEALQTIFEFYPDFIKQSDHHYDPPRLEVLMCIEMDLFAEYIWNVFAQEAEPKFSQLKDLITQLNEYGNETVRYAVQMCFAETLERLNRKTDSPFLTRLWLSEFGSILIVYSSYWEEKSSLIK
ncbi:DUF7674 family protein [Deinococcus ruber]|uniref:DUF7674 domain-containing protein n=1 Tax=Deinococcus ruber TaxID=1848197 RepID=A0A918CH26_9DEIO|nr:hypothetical protein [Deinococcus ruber]GGR22743.1 hypothetical protein GCM10008957_38480 [Deinococcus ruber]